jgi:hypothetical protein
MFNPKELLATGTIKAGIILRGHTTGQTVIASCAHLMSFRVNNDAAYLKIFILRPVCNVIAQTYKAPHPDVFVSHIS